MARIDRHPQVKDYIIEMNLAEIDRRGGVADWFEQGQLILISDYRLPVDYSVFEDLNKKVEEIESNKLRRKVKKLTTAAFLVGEVPRKKSIFSRSDPALIFRDPVRQAVFDVLCKGDSNIFNHVCKELRVVHDEIQRIFKILFPNYHPFKLIPSIRLTQTLFENLHWDNHSIDDDFHQARLFANIDSRPRIWHISYHSDDYLRQVYEEYDLGRFAGKDPNLMLEFVNSHILGGTKETWMERLPKHRLAFEPGEVWSGESRLISHQIFYGEAAAVFMWFMHVSDMVNPQNRFNERVALVHRAMMEGKLSARH